MAESTSTGGKATDVNNGKLTIDQENNRITLDDGTTTRIIFGLFPDGTLGFLTVKATKDVFDVIG